VKILDAKTTGSHVVKLVLAIILLPSLCYAGIINTLPEIPSHYGEELLTAKLSASLDWQHGNNKQLDIKAAGNLFLQREFWSLYITSSFTRSTSNNALEAFDTLNHIRVRYFFLYWLGLEAYTQHEYDTFRKLDTRYLAGIGSTFKIIDTDYFDVMVGTSALVEFIRPSEQLPEEVNFRWSNYVQAEFSINERLTIQNIFFYQMRFDDPRDVTIFESVSLEIKAFDWFGVALGFTLSHDERPLPGVEKTDLGLTSALFVEYQ